MRRDHQALVAFIHARQARPFDWGANDKRADSFERGNSCVHFAAGAVFVQTGRAIMPLLPGWKTPAGALAAIGKMGGLEAAGDSLFRRVPLALAQRGDIALVGDADNEVLMVIEGEMLVGPDASGARRLRRTRMEIAWSAA